jgi:phosphate transport system substrate-binding protein
MHERLDGMMKKTFAVAALAAAMIPAAAFGQARDQIRIVGSSTVFPFSTAVAEAFGRQGKFKTPVVESTGTGGGMRLFCAGVGTGHPDMTNASRPMTKSEFESCNKNGVTDITEVKIGFDGIVIADKLGSAKMNLSRKDIYLALAEKVPLNGGLAENPYKTWAQVNPNLPNTKIEVIGPPPTSGTRDAFIELVMDFGCKDFPEIKAITDAKIKLQACSKIREDGAYIEAGENDNLIIQKLNTSPEALGIFGYSFLDQNKDKVQGSQIEGVDSTFENISSGKFPISRSIFFYVKNAHVGVIPGIKEFVTEFVSEKAFGSDGYLTDKGLIPLPTADRAKVREASVGLTKLAM